MNNENEKELLQKLAEGDKFSFGILFNIYHQRLFHFALHYLGDDEAAKDVVQDVYTIVWESHEKFVEVTNLSSWLFTTTKNQCLKKIDHLKVRQKHSDILKYRQLGVAMSALSELDTSPITFNEINNIITKTLDSLSPQARRIFELSRFENKKNREIADELGISIKTVEAKMTSTLKVFRKSLKHYLPFVIYLLY